MSSCVLAIDPATKALGLALFYNKSLIQTATVRATGDDRYDRTKMMIGELMGCLMKTEERGFDWNCDKLTVVCEEPLLRGKGNKAMERLLGQLEFLFYSRINYFSPSQVKAAMGSGSYDKLEVALAAGRMLETSKEQDIVANLIAKEEWDATDAVAIGLTYLKKVGVK